MKTSWEQTRSEQYRKRKADTLGKTNPQVYELVTKEYKRLQSCQEYHEEILAALKEQDGQIFGLITKEYERRRNTLQLVAAENQCSKAVLAALGSIVQNKTAEGFPGSRRHGGCSAVDKLEKLAVARAREAFGAQYANVQPHSGTAANQIVLTAMLGNSDRILSMGTEHGGHFSHGAAVSFTGKFFEVENYCVDRKSFRLDYDAIRAQAMSFKPKLIICGASAYSRAIDFRKFREIADSVGAYLLADISHISGLVMARAHQTPIDYAHFTTTSTYKPGGPRGGLIVMGRDYDREVEIGGKKLALWQHIEKATFPGVQGTPYLNHIAAKGVFFKEVLSSEYQGRQFRIIENAKRLAGNLFDLGHDVLTGGTDNHLILVNVASLREGLTGHVAQKCLEECGIIADAIQLPYDEKNDKAGSGIRLGTPIITRSRMDVEQIDLISDMIDTVLRNVDIVSDTEYKINISLKEQIKAQVINLCSKFPPN